MLEFMILVIFGQNGKQAIKNAWHWCKLKLIGKCTVAAVVDPSVADPSLNQEINGASRVRHARNAVHVKSTLPLYQKGSKWNHETDLCFHQIHFKIYERVKTNITNQIKPYYFKTKEHDSFHYCFECKIDDPSTYCSTDWPKTPWNCCHVYNSIWSRIYNFYVFSSFNLVGSINTFPQFKKNILTLRRHPSLLFLLFITAAARIY